MSTELQLYAIFVAVVAVVLAVIGILLGWSIIKATRKEMEDMKKDRVAYNKTKKTIKRTKS